MARDAKICALLTCFNRKSSTLKCLTLLEASAAAANIDLAAILVDDGNDGTGQEAQKRFPWLLAIPGTGSLYWNRGMLLAQETAKSAMADRDLLWLNDDTHLFTEGLQLIIRARNKQDNLARRPSIIVGATTDESRLHVTYSGQRKGSCLRPFRLTKVFDSAEAQACDTMNGNVVYVPRCIAEDVGDLDPVFEHALGDIDYGLRARRRGHPIFVTPGFVGTCDNNNKREGTRLDPTLSIRERWRLMQQPKGLPMKPWLTFTRRHGGVLWPLHFIWPYVHLILNSSWKRSKRQT